METTATKALEELFTPSQQAASQPIVGQVMNISTTTFVSALANAFSTSRYSLHLELAVGMALFIGEGGVHTDSKSSLQHLYTAAGHDSATPEGSEYKSVRRKINLVAALYIHISHDKLLEWIGGSREMIALSAIVMHLEQLDLRTYDSVALLVGKSRPAPKHVPSHPEAGKEAPQKSEEEALNEHIAVEQQRVEEYLRAQAEGKETGEFEFLHEDEHHGPWHPELSPRPDYPEWIDKEGTQHIVLSNVNVNIAQDVSKDDLIAAAMRLLSMAEKMDEGSSNGNGKEHVPEPPQSIMKEHEEELEKMPPKAPLMESLKELIESYQPEEPAKEPSVQEPAKEGVPETQKPTVVRRARKPRNEQ